MSSSILRIIAATAITKQKCSGGGGGRNRMLSTAAGVNPSRISPWLMLPPSSSQAYKLYSLASKKVLTFNTREPPLSPSPSPPLPSAEGQVRLVGSSHGWVATFNTENHHIFLSDPISGRHMKLPDIHTLPESLFRFNTVVEKIILTSPPGAECLAVMIFNARGMAVCSPGGGGAKWSWFGGEYFYKDMVYSSRRHRLFTIGDNEGLEAECWDLSDPESPPSREWAMKLDLDDSQGLTSSRSEEEAEGFHREVKYLVFAEEWDRLLLVTRFVYEQAGSDGSFTDEIYLGLHRGYDYGCPYKTFAFDVHEIDYWTQTQSKNNNNNRHRPRYVEDGCLNGLAVFVGSNHSFAVPAAEFPELKADSIYFTEAQEFMMTYYYRDLNYGGHDIGIFNYKERTFSSAYYPCHASHFTYILPPPIWFTPTT